MKTKKRIVLFVILLAAAILAAILVVVTRQGKSGNDGGLFTLDEVAAREALFGKGLDEVLDGLGLTRAAGSKRPYSPGGWRRTKKYTLADTQFNQDLYFTQDPTDNGKMTQYRFERLGPNGASLSFEEVQELVNVLTSQAMDLYGEPFSIENSHVCTSAEELLEEIQSTDFSGYRYIQWKIGEKTQFYINVGGSSEDGYILTVNYTEWDYAAQFMTEDTM